MKKIHWRKPDERPDNAAPIYFLTYKDNHWSLHEGSYYNYEYEHMATGEKERREYVEEPVFDMEVAHNWEDVKKWCYFKEFEEILKKTF